MSRSLLHHRSFNTSRNISGRQRQPIVYLYIKYFAIHPVARSPLSSSPDTQVFRLLNKAAQGNKINLPKLDSIRPFLDLFTLVILSPEELSGHDIAAHHMPELSIVEGDKFVPAPTDTLPDAPGVARIFDVLAISDKRAKTYLIPLSPEHAEFPHQRYWRLPASVRPEVVLMLLMERIRWVTGPVCDEIKHARAIYCILYLNATGAHEIRIPSSRKRTSGEQNDNDTPPCDETGPESAQEDGRSGQTVKRTRKTAQSPGPQARKIRRLKI